jgi:hypothetical protein
LDAREGRKKLKVRTYFISIAIQVIYWFAANYLYIHGKFPSLFHSSKLAIYACSLLLFMGSYLLIRYLSIKLPTGRKERKGSRQNEQAPTEHTCKIKEGETFPYIAFFATVIIMGIALMVVYLNYGKVYPYHEGLAGLQYWYNISPILIFIGLLLAFVVFLDLTNGLYGFSTEASGWKPMLVFSALVALMAGYAAYAPNPFATYSNVFNNGAYDTSVYNCFYGIPFGREVTAQYGYYGIFFAPFLRVAGFFGVTNIFRIYSMLISGLMMLSSLASAYIVCHFAKNKSLRCITIIACSSLLIWSGRFHQLFPSRLLPLVLVSAFIVVSLRHPEKRILVNIFGCVLSGLCLVWSTENGVVAAVGWLAFLMMQNLQTCAIPSKRFWKNTVLIVCSMAFSFLIFIGVIDIYNLLCGGSPISINMLFPRTFSEQLLTALESTTLSGKGFPMMLGPWWMMLALAYIFIGEALSNIHHACSATSIERNAANAAAYFAIAVLTVGGMAYFMLRPVSTYLGSVFPLCFVLLSILASKQLPEMREFALKFKARISIPIHACVKAAFGFSVVFVIFAIAMGTITSLGFSLMRFDIYRDAAHGQQYADAVAREIPEGTWGLGFGVIETYALLGWDTGFHTTDIQDLGITQESIQYLYTSLQNHSDEPILTTSDVLNTLQARPDDTSLEMMAWFEQAYILDKEFTVGDGGEYGYTITFQYYTPAFKGE